MAQRPSTPLARAELGALLEHGLAGLGLELDAARQSRLLDYLALMQKWNAVYNLTAIRDPRDMLSAHLLDSLAVVPLVRAHGIRHLLDVGSGGGLPGIPLAIVLPDLQVDLVDAVQKKAAFQTQVRAELGLANVRSHHARVESLTLPHQPDGIVSRAFAELADMVRLAGPLLTQGGVMLAMKGVVPHDEIARLPQGWGVSAVTPLHVPGLDAQRCVVAIQRQS